VRDARGVVMESDALEASTWRRNLLCFLASALLTVIGLGPRTVSAAECGPHCDVRAHPSQYSDPRCESRRSGPRLERDELRCDLREPRRRAAPSATTTPPLPPVPPIGPAPVTGATDPGRQQSRGVERDVGFDDAAPTQSNPTPGAGAHSTSPETFRRGSGGRR
jgi:hypothetical protein